MRGIKFYSLLDFYPRKERIKNLFEEMKLDDRILFKKEVYSLCFEKEHVKDLIWEYLNNFTESKEELDRQYNIKKNKVEQRQKYDSKDTIETRQLE